MVTNKKQSACSELCSLISFCWFAKIVSWTIEPGMWGYCHESCEDILKAAAATTPPPSPPAEKTLAAAVDPNTDGGDSSAGVTAGVCVALIAIVACVAGYAYYRNK